MKLNSEEKDILTMYMSITGNKNQSEVYKLLMQSQTFRWVHENDPETLYDGGCANLLQAVSEIKSLGKYPKEMDKITVESISDWNKQQKNQHLPKKPSFMKKFIAAVF